MGAENRESRSQRDSAERKKQSDKKVITVRLTEEEKQKLEYCSNLCGLSQSEFIRQLCKGKAPKPQPKKEFWEVLEALYAVHNSFKSCAKFEPSALEICKEIECLILDLQEVGQWQPLHFGISKAD